METENKKLSESEIELAKSQWEPTEVERRFSDEIFTIGKLTDEEGHPILWDKDCEYDVMRGLQIYDSSVALDGQRETVNEQSMITDPAMIKLSDMILDEAIKENVSDIRIDQFEHFGLVHFAHGKDWENHRLLYKSSVNPLITFMKKKSGLKFKLENAKEPQTNGKIVVGKTNFRVSCGQSQFGMFISLRVQGTNIKSLEDADFPPLIKSEIRKAVSAKDGLTIMGGPVGSGKSTLQNAAIIERLHNTNGAINVVSIEMPIEKTIPGVVQEQIDPEAGLTWEGAIEASLRQMPTILRVGEVNSPASAQAIVKAANSGIVAMTTMHIKSTLEVFQTLQSNNVSENDIKNSLNMVLYLNRVPALCDHCKIPESNLLHPEYDKWVEKTLNDGKPANVPTFFIRNPEGCEVCREGQKKEELYGTKGSVGVYELLKINQPLLRIWRRYSKYDVYVLKDKLLHPETIDFDDGTEMTSDLDEETSRAKAERNAKLTDGLMYIPLEQDIIQKLREGRIDIPTAKYLVNE